MPLYTFACRKHGEFDMIVAYDTPMVKCPKCRKLIPRAGVEVPARRNPEHGIQK